MNAMGMMLLGSIAHATLFAIAGMAAYMAIKRWEPAAGSLAAGSSLAIMAMVSIAALSPWPRWWTFGGAGQAPAVVKVTGSDAARTVGVGSVAEGPAGGGRDPSGRGRFSEPVPSLMELFVDEIRKPSDITRAERWGWREWLAAVFLASLVMGAARLGIGLWGIARLRATSRPVADRELEELIEILRAEIGCRRRVAVREADDLTTPATIGWRRPVLLLPSDWQGWDHDERRAVLAHELAHVRRGDFPAGVAAQAAVAMHFYHPLAHWLAARLRLEQELAADAWGARVSGGEASYLATLARMALRRDGGAITWPARASLPSHGTFVRRIEMLKNHGPIRHVTLPTGARLLTVAALAAVGLLVAGLRGPAGDSPVLAQDRPAGTPGAGVAPDSHNMAFVPAEARMVVSALRPASLLRHREMRPLLTALRDGPLFRDGFPIPPEDIEQVLLFWESSEAGPGRGSFLSRLSGFVVRADKPQDWKALFGKVAAMHGTRVEEARHDGQEYFRIGGGGPMPWAVYAADRRTLVAAEEVVLRDLITDRNAPAPRHPWDEAWKKVAGGQVMMALDTRWLRRELARAQPGQARGPMLGPETFSPLYEKARSYALSLNASERSLTIDLVAEVGASEDGKAVAETLQAILTLGKNTLEGVRRDLPRSAGPRSEAADWIVQAADSVLDRARVETAEGFVRLHAESAVDLAEGIRSLLPAVTSAQAANRRYQSVNNLKQIGLAFHNYQSANGHFPAAVNRDKGQFPYSWRVAILPYIEQQELYSQYKFDEPWDGPNNRKLIDKMPAIYAYPGFDGTPSSRSSPSYFVFTGDSTVGGAEGGSKLEQITDGASNTILAVEARRDIPWTRPEDIPFAANAAVPEMGGFTPEGSNAVFCDGSVRYLKKSINPIVMKALITRNGGEVVSSDTY